MTLLLLLCVCFSCHWLLFLLWFYWEHVNQGQPLPFKSVYVFGKQDQWTKNTLLLAVLCKDDSILEGDFKQTLWYARCRSKQLEVKSFWDGGLEHVSWHEEEVWVALPTLEMEQPSLSLCSCQSRCLHGCFLWLWLAGAPCTEPTNWLLKHAIDKLLLVFSVGDFPWKYKGEGKDGSGWNLAYYYLENNKASVFLVL